MIDVKVAVKNAKEYLQDVSGHLDYLLVEEVELDEKEENWLITFGFNFGEEVETTQEQNTLFPHPTITKKSPVRLYKLIRVNAESGKVEAMRIRNV